MRKKKIRLEEGQGSGRGFFIGQFSINKLNNNNQNPCLCVSWTKLTGLTEDTEDRTSRTKMTTFHRARARCMGLVLGPGE